MPDIDSTRKINTLEKHREEGRQKIQGVDVAELVVVATKYFNHNK